MRIVNEGLLDSGKMRNNTDDLLLSNSFGNAIRVKTQLPCVKYCHM